MRNSNEENLYESFDTNSQALEFDTGYTGYINLLQDIKNEEGDNLSVTLMKLETFEEYWFNRNKEYNQFNLFHYFIYLYKKFSDNKDKDKIKKFLVTVIKSAGEQSKLSLLHSREDYHDETTQELKKTLMTPLQFALQQYQLPSAMQILKSILENTPEAFKSSLIDTPEDDKKSREYYKNNRKKFSLFFIETLLCELTDDQNNNRIIETFIAGILNNQYAENKPSSIITTMTKASPDKKEKNLLQIMLECVLSLKKHKTNGLQSLTNIFDNLSKETFDHYNQICSKDSYGNLQKLANHKLINNTPEEKALLKTINLEKTPQAIKNIEGRFDEILKRLAAVESENLALKSRVETLEQTQKSPEKPLNEASDPKTPPITEPLISNQETTFQPPKAKPLSRSTSDGMHRSNDDTGTHNNKKQKTNQPASNSITTEEYVEANRDDRIFSFTLMPENCGYSLFESYKAGNKEKLRYQKNEGLLEKKTPSKSRNIRVGAWGEETAFYYLKNKYEHKYGQNKTFTENEKTFRLEGYKAKTNEKMIITIEFENYKQFTNHWQNESFPGSTKKPYDIKIIKEYPDTNCTKNHYIDVKTTSFAAERCPELRVTRSEYELAKQCDKSSLNKKYSIFRIYEAGKPSGTAKEKISSPHKMLEENEQAFDAIIFKV